MKKHEKLFRSKAPWIMALLLRDFPIELDDAAAIVGNWGHECGGFTLMQEQKPTVKGSKGGYGWAQWTGPRRKNFERYCQRNNLDPASDQANYKFAFVELRGAEKAAIPAVRKAKTLNGKVKAFELAFERAGVKHYKSRNAYAAIAIDAWHKAGNVQLPEWAGEAKESDRPPAAPSPRPKPPSRPAPRPGGKEPEKEDKPKKLRWSKRLWNGLVALFTGGSIGGAGLDLWDVDRSFFVVAGCVVVACALITILFMPEVRKQIGKMLLGLISAVVLTVLPAIAWDAVRSHEAPKGWSYPFSCCSGYDCREVNASAIGEKTAGYVIKGTGELVPYADSRVKDSPDGAWHWCSVAGKNDGKTICLFVPPKSF